MTYTGTPPKNIRYILRANAATKKILVRFPYNAGAYSVKVAGKIIDYQPMDDATSKPKAIDVKTAVCGANRFVGIENYLEFFV